MSKVIASIRRIINIHPMVGLELILKKSYGKPVYDLVILEEGKNRTKVSNDLLRFAGCFKTTQTAPIQVEFYGDDAIGMNVYPNKLTLRGTSLARAVTLYTVPMKDTEETRTAVIQETILKRFEDILNEFSQITRDFIVYGDVPRGETHMGELWTSIGYAKLISGRGFKFVRTIYRVFDDRVADVITIKGLDAIGMMYSINQDKDREGGTGVYDTTSDRVMLTNIINAMECAGESEQERMFMFPFVDQEGVDDLIRETTYVFKRLGLDDKSFVGVNCDQCLGHSKTFWDNDVGITQEFVNALRSVLSNEVFLN